MSRKPAIPPPGRPASSGPGRRPFAALRVTTDQVVLAAALFWALACNRGLAQAAVHDRALADPGTWGFVAALLLMLTALHVLLLAPLAHRTTVKPLVALLTLTAAVGSYFIGAFGVVLDPTMLRNVLRTEPAEARELLSTALALHLAAFALLPIALLWRVEVVRRPWGRALLARLGLVALALAVLGGGVWALFQPLSSWMRNHKEARYLMTPANILWSTGSVLAADARGARQPRQAIGLDATPGPSWAARRKPLVVVLVVGETARAANWQLAGYARPTTPQLARLPVIDFGAVAACGTNTETSLPCMFAPVGRRDHDEDRIRGQQSLLHVVARAGVGVHWRDNQSGCKGVCDGLPAETLSARTAPALCEGERCLDEALVHDLDARLAKASGTQLWVLHMLGNHGPSYFRRYPPAFAHFQPECRNDDLRRCSTEEIVNAYDNALRYTDHVLAAAIAQLANRRDQVDSALLYVSDHGESLGERGLYLHGLPYRIAPAEQTQVPMLWWASPGLEAAAGLAPGCLAPALKRAAAGRQVAHDHLFHTLLGLLDVRTALHEPAWDLSATCRQADPR